MLFHSKLQRFSFHIEEKTCINRIVCKGQKKNFERVAIHIRLKKKRERHCKIISKPTVYRKATEELRSTKASGSFILVDEL